MSPAAYGRTSRRLSDPHTEQSNLEVQTLERNATGRSVISYDDDGAGRLHEGRKIAHNTSFWALCGLGQSSEMDGLLFAKVSPEDCLLAHHLSMVRPTSLASTSMHLIKWNSLPLFKKDLNFAMTSILQEQLELQFKLEAWCHTLYSLPATYVLLYYVPSTGNNRDETAGQTSVSALALLLQ